MSSKKKIPFEPPNLKLLKKLAQVKIAAVEAGNSHSPALFITLLEEQTVQFLGTLSHSKQFNEQNFVQIQWSNNKQESELDDIAEGEGGKIGVGVGNGDDVLFAVEFVIFYVSVVFVVLVMFAVSVVFVSSVKFV